MGFLIYNVREIQARHQGNYLCLGLLEVFIIGRVLGKLSTGSGKVKDLALARFHLVTVLRDRNLKEGSYDILTDLIRRRTVSPAGKEEHSN